MADDLFAVDKFLADLNKNLERVPRDAGRDIATMGKAEVLRLATSVFGGDRKFSGARRSRKAKRAATARARVFSSAGRVEIYPSGDPFYIFMKGRGGGRLERPRRARALRTPVGPRATSHVGRLAPRPNLIDPAERAIQQRAPIIISAAVDVAIAKAVI